MRNQAASLVFVSLFAALTAVGAFLKIPIPHVPFTLQTLMVMFAGLTLGSRRGAASQILYIVVGLMGIPVFAQGGGPAYVLQPSFGFLLGFIAGAYVIGKVAESAQELTVFRAIIALAAGQAAIYAFGLSYLYLNLNFILHKDVSIWTAIKIGLLVFLPGDLLKIAVAAAVALPARNRLPSRIRG
ncbi:MAG TPA: biotin transporter BioY [Thermodesulfobacteriota bacterium]|nr:biotin transporter BioY [Thermodesulfobacteriota bacterium]